MVRDLEEQAARNPKGFLWRVGMLAAFGYAYILGVALLMLALTVGLIVLICMFPNALTIKFGLAGVLVCGGMGLGVLRALWVRLSPPEGVRLTEDQVPELFAMLRGLERDLGAPRFHEVLLVGDSNAAVTQVPRLGVFGWYRNYLVLGLPLMQGLGPEEFKSVLAHELGHLSGGHGRFGNWLYRMRRSWEGIFESLATRHHGALAGLITGFVKWYWPKFNAHAFVLSRANEYEADATAARLTSPTAAANALLRSRVQFAALEEHFWPALYRRANTDPVTPGDLFDQIGAFLRSPWQADDVKRWLKASFLIETNNADTHPCLRDRLRGLHALPPGIESGVFPTALPEASPMSAAEAYLGKAMSTLAQGLNDRWRENVATSWSERHQHAKSLSQVLTPPPLPTSSHLEKVEVLWKRATALLDLDGDDAAAPLLEELLGLKADHAGACFVLGRRFLAKDDSRGVELIERALRTDHSLVQPGLELLYNYYARTGQRDQLRPLENRADQHRELEATATRERSDIKPTDTFLPHPLTEEQLAGIREILKAHPDVLEAWIVRKQVIHFPETPCFVLTVKIRTTWWTFRSDNPSQTTINSLSQKMALPGNLYLFADEKDLTKVARVIQAVSGSLIYQRVNPQS